MNYIRHTRAAHEQLSQQPNATPHHVSLYWALFYQWNAARFPATLELDHQATMQAAHIGNKSTYTEKLYDLEAWGLLTYQPSQSRHQLSRCFLTVLPNTEVHQVDELTGNTSASSETAPLVAEVHTVNSLTSTASATGKPELPGTEVEQHSLLGKTSGRYKPLPQNGRGSAGQKSKQCFVNDRLSENCSTFSADGAAEAPKDSAHEAELAPKRKGVKQAAVREAADLAPINTTRTRRQQRPEVPFADSELASYEAFATTFEGTDYALADLRYYHARISAWRQKGEPPRRRDWRATAIQFFLNDAHDNRLKLAPGVHAYQPGSNSPTNAGTLFARTGYRSKYDT